eukprot:comp9524_c0_seq1/m.4553 comp9524_c0_seq1/g.4553  ORF comp9524_c0_seq1/g.4553 comp9524_c0_seq1/m.4553 type:complete len:482 (-) comp9524_c0_seq1:342-1787(-)
MHATGRSTITEHLTCTSSFLRTKMHHFVFLLAFFLPPIFSAPTRLFQQNAVTDLPSYCNVDTFRDTNMPATKITGADLRLKHVNVVFRHGDRTIYERTNCWPTDVTWQCDLAFTDTPALITDPKNRRVDRLFLKQYDAGPNAQKGNCYIGALTVRGYKQEHLNGEALRREYVDSGFLPKKLNESQVWLRADDVPRTIQSLEALINGMYPPHHQSNGRTNHVALHVMETLNDPIILSSHICPKANNYSQMWRQSHEYLLHQTLVTDPLWLDVAKASGLSGDVINLDGFADCALVHQCWGKALPDWLSPDLYNRLMDEQRWQAYSKLYFPSRQEAARTQIGFLVREIHARLLYHAGAKVDPSLLTPGYDRKLSFFSGHDSTAIALLAALGFNDFDWPKYATMIQFELYEATPHENTEERAKDPPTPVFSSHYVRLIVNGKVTPMPFCSAVDEDGLCPLPVFSRYAGTITMTPEEASAECKVGH